MKHDELPTHQGLRAALRIYSGRLLRYIRVWAAIAAFLALPLFVIYGIAHTESTDILVLWIFASVATVAIVVELALTLPRLIEDLMSWFGKLPSRKDQGRRHV